MPRTQDEVGHSTESTSASSSTGSSSNSVRPSPPAAEPHPGSLPLSSNHPSAVCVEVPLEVHGSRRANVQGQPAEPFNEETFSVIVFPNGGIVRLEATVIAGQMLAITNRNSQRGILCRVTNVRNYPKLKSYVEVVFSQPAPGFWGVRFPDEGAAHYQEAPAPRVQTPAPTQAEVANAPAPQQSAKPAPDAPKPQPQLPAARHQASARIETPHASTKVEPQVERAAASLKNLAAEVASAFAPPAEQEDFASFELQDESAAAEPIAEVSFSEQSSSQHVDELSDISAEEMSQLVEALEEAQSTPLAPARPTLVSHPQQSQPAQSQQSQQPQTVPPAESSDSLQDDFWSTSFPEEILNWAIETAAIPSQSTATQSSAPVSAASHPAPAAVAPSSVTPTKEISKQPLQAASTITPAQPKSAQPASAAAPPAPKQIAKPQAPAAAAPPKPSVAAKSTAPTATAPKLPSASDAHPDADTESLDPAMLLELERLALAHLGNEDEDDVAPEDDAKSIFASKSPATLVPTSRSIDPIPARRLSRADRKALASRSRTKFNPRETSLTGALAGASASARNAANAVNDDDADTILIDATTAVLLKPMQDGIPLGPLLGATQEYDPTSVAPLDQGITKRANYLVAVVALIMLVLVGGGWWLLHQNSTPARALPEPTGPSNAQPSAQPTGSYNQPASQPASSNVDSLDAAAAAAIKAGANTTPADAAATSAPAHLMNQPAASQPAPSHPAASQPTSTQPSSSQPSSFRPANVQPLSSPPAASPPIAANSSAPARAREASPLLNDDDSPSRSSSANYTHKLLIPAVKLHAPEVANTARSNSNASAPPPVISGSATAGASGPGINAIVPNPEGSMPAPSAPVRAGVSTVGGRVREPKLVAKVTPVYPAEARQFNVQGEVTIDATIDSHGNVTAMRIISGPSVLQRAAMDALREWKYEPSTLNDRPVSVHTIVTIKFTR